MNNNLRTVFKDGVVIFLIALTAYAQVALMLRTLKYDILDQYLVWRRYAAECLQQGIIPLWNPYQHMGYVFSADPQSGAWYPLVWLASITGGYSIYFCHLEFFFHVLLAGIGMYWLVRHCTNCRLTALAGAIAYLCSGFFVGNAQHLPYIISGAWFPLVILFYFKMTTSYRLLPLLCFSGCLFMMTAGGYPAFTIITAYLLVVLFLIRLFVLIKQERRRWLSFFISHLLALLATVLLSAFVLTNLLQNLEYIAKGRALPLELAQYNPFSPQSLLSLLWPLVTTTDTAFFGTDMSMANMHFGLMMLLALAMSFTLKFNRHHVLLMAASFIFLLASFGEYTPVRAWLYHWLPLMDTFRFPSIFRLFALFGFLLLAGRYLKKVFSDASAAQHFVKWLFITTCLIAASGLIIALWQGAAIPLSILWSSGFYLFIHQLSFNDALMLQSLLLLVLAAGTMMCLTFLKIPARKVVIIYLIAEMLLAVQLNAPRTVYGEYTPAGVHQTMKSLPEGFPVPDNKPAAFYSDSTGLKAPFWRNLSLMRKQPGYDGYNSFRMLYYDSLADSPPLLNLIKRNTTAFAATSFSFYSQHPLSESGIDKRTAHLFFHDSLKPFIPQIAEPAPATVRYLHYAPDKIAMEVKSESPQLVTLMQHFHPMWKVFVNGKEQKYVVSNYFMMTVDVGSGTQCIEFIISNPVAVAAFWISLLSLLALPVVCRLTAPMQL
jgi:hypothetical protein